jgi:chromosome segregation ATPase
LVNPTGYERAVDELQQAEDRITELEATVKELSDAWNQFATEEETKQGLEEARREMARRFQAIRQMEEGPDRNTSMQQWQGQMQQLNRVLLDGRK